MRFVSLWQGPVFGDSVEFEALGGIWVMGVWHTRGLYGLDSEGRPWALCSRTRGKLWKWILVEDLMSGAAGRAAVAEQREDIAL